VIPTYRKEDIWGGQDEMVKRKERLESIDLLAVSNIITITFDVVSNDVSVPIGDDIVIANNVILVTIAND
jgi:hypothetical protein